MADGAIEPRWPVGWDGDRSAMLSTARRFARRYEVL